MTCNSQGLKKRVKTGLFQETDETGELIWIMTRHRRTIFMPQDCLPVIISGILVTRKMVFDHKNW
jgi:hypothetical protein